MSSRKSSRESHSPTPDSGTPPPPPYKPIPLSPLIVTEMTTTRTEVVTTTTETTTHLFSLPYWRKRNDRPSPPSSRNSLDTSPRPRSSRTLLVDKALPPTPPDDTQDSYEGLGPAHGSTGSTSFPAPLPPDSLRPRKPSTGPSSASALAQAALGLGLPHASASLTLADVSSVAFTLSSLPTPSPTVPPNGVRRAKSSQRVRARHVSEDHERPQDADPRANRRRRGLSFGAASFLNLAIPDIKGKGKEPEPMPSSSKQSPKPLSRKPSFWSKKKDTQVVVQAVSSPSPEGTTVVVLPSLPPVHQVSPFDIHDFAVSSSSSTTGKDKPILSPGMSRSYSDKLAPYVPSDATMKTPMPPASISLDLSQRRPSQERTPELPLNPDPPILHRLRTQTSSPLLHRLSMGVFSSHETSPAPSPRSSAYNLTNSLPHLGRKPETVVPKPLGEEESPEVYLLRLKAAVSKAEIAGTLASSSDPFYVQALRTHINQFDFLDIPLDVALRKLLMEVGLPRETQQIDRVMEAFAFRYMQCNPELFISEDHPYILAFSLIMLHTDAFNPSNKRKMTKPDYIKNTKLPGISTEVLDCFFDNIVFAPFIFIEDPVDFNGQPGLTPDIARSMIINSPTSTLPSSTGSAFKIGNKVDPYYLIANNLLDPLRIDVDSQIPLENPFNYEGTHGPWDEAELHHAFVHASVIEIEAPLFNRASPIFSLAPSVAPSPQLINGEGSGRTKVEPWSLKITKVGLLNRKDDFNEGGKKSLNRKWKTWSVVLTGSQLLFFRDPAWAAALQPSPPNSPRQTLFPPTGVFRPDELFSVKDAVAVYDRSYTKYNHTLRLVLADGRHILLQAVDEKDMNEWISRTNYASTFKSAGVRMRPPELSGEDVHLTGVAAATSHLHDMQERFTVPRPRSWDSNAPNDLMDMLAGETGKRLVLPRRVTMTGGRSDLDADVPVAPEIDGAEQFKATFDQVKADLAAGYLSSPEEPWLQDEGNIYESLPASPLSFNSQSSRLPSRSQIIRSKIRELDSKISTFQSQLDHDLRCIRNIAILTPFQKSTRSRLSLAVQSMSARVMQVRLDLEKVRCHHSVLRRDLVSEGQCWSQSKRVALRAAKETLQSRSAHNISTMPVSLPDQKSRSTADILSTPPSPQPPSSSCGSFHSAIDEAIEWPSSEDLAFLAVPQNSEPPRTGFSTSSLTFQDDFDSPAQVRQKSMPLSHSNIFGQHNSSSSPASDAEEDEQAEEWNKTRCAQRVSLIHVPSDIRIRTRLQGGSDS